MSVFNNLRKDKSERSTGVFSRLEQNSTVRAAVLSGIVCDVICILPFSLECNDIIMHQCGVRQEVRRRHSETCIFHSVCNILSKTHFEKKHLDKMTILDTFPRCCSLV